MQGLPPIEFGHFLYAFAWALIGLCVSASAWSNWKEPTYKDYLAGSLGISLEALGVEIASREPALVVPLVAGLFFALLIRYLPERRAFGLKVRPRLVPGILSMVMVFGFFMMQVFVLLLAYRGWWDRFVLYPGG